MVSLNSLVDHIYGRAERMEDNRRIDENFRGPIAVRACARCCVRLMDNMVVVCATAKTAGKVPNAIYH